MGNRVCKIEKPYNLTSTGWKYTFYVRDASGNIMTTYTKTGSEIENNVLKLDEVMLYGSSRIGTREVNTLLSGLTVPTTTFIRALGLKRYELSNHLGNVLATFTDRKKQVQSGSSVTGYETYIASAQDYYPFGMIMNERKWNTSGYRFGFGGKEKDDEVKGIGNSLDFGARIYDSRTGRWLSIDPLQIKYPMYSPYIAFGANPITIVDVDGKDIKLYTITYSSEYYYESEGNTQFTTTTTEGLTNKNTIQAMQDYMDTPQGYAYVAQFAKAGDVISIGDKKYSFNKDGALKDQNLIFNDYNNMREGSTSAAGMATMSYSYEVTNEGNGLSKEFNAGHRISIKSPMNESDIIEGQFNATVGGEFSRFSIHTRINVIIDLFFDAHKQESRADNALTIAHETFIHDVSKLVLEFVNNKKKALNGLNNSNIEDGGKVDHNKYLKNNWSIPKFMNYIKSLGVKLGKKEIGKAKEEHDKNVK